MSGFPDRIGGGGVPDFVSCWRWAGAIDGMASWQLALRLGELRKLPQLALYQQCVVESMSLWQSGKIGSHPAAVKMAFFGVDPKKVLPLAGCSATRPPRFFAALEGV